MSLIGGSESFRYFKIISVNNKKIKDEGRYKTKGSPGDAAKKAFTQLSKKYKTNKLTFSIKETTQGSNKKEHGPYLGEKIKLKKPLEIKYEGKNKPVIIKYETKIHLVKDYKQKGGGNEYPINYLTDLCARGDLRCEPGRWSLITSTRSDKLRFVPSNTARTPVEIQLVDQLENPCKLLEKSKGWGRLGMGKEEPGIIKPNRLYPNTETAIRSSLGRAILTEYASQIIYNIYKKNDRNNDPIIETYDEIEFRYAPAIGRGAGRKAASEMFRYNTKKELMKDKLRRGEILSLSDEMKNDKELMLAALVHKGSFLDYASEGLKNDKEVVLAAVAQNPFSLQFASLELKNDREVVLTAVAQKGLALGDASIELKNDRELVLTAVAENGMSLQFASLELKNDREVVLTAVAQKGTSLQFASLELKNDREVVLTAVAQNGWALQHASKAIQQSDREIQQAYVNYFRGLSYLPPPDAPRHSAPWI